MEDPDDLPDARWWEIWLRRDSREAFEQIARLHELRTSTERISFPEREVILAFGTQIEVGRVVMESNAVAEVRRPKIHLLHSWRCAMTNRLYAWKN